MRKAVFASAVALAMMGPLFVSEEGDWTVAAAAQDVVVTEGKIARLRSALRLTGEQLQHWRPVEAALRAAIRGAARGPNEVWCRRCVTGFTAMPAARLRCSSAMSAAGPLIASLDERRASGRNALRSMGGAAMF